MLQVSLGNAGINRFECRTCPYEFPIVSSMSMYHRTPMTRKEVDDVLGGKGSWDNVDQTAAQCPMNCGGEDKAYFFQLQIRSADEPMTTFYKCTNCAHQWREN
ncbi:hypothetical protein DV451_001514 [Geotrichum candidum]|nr:hypothetical protein DV451_001514 [Geotrichum candidum]KAF5106373.1 hypothetical protein DV453_004025 [Geotrichum candidum]KAF5114447.1 hypothetical protein DV454_002950 [Geotrichum candidum]KAF5121215.1 hypothetical protein DV452_001002 [Geotrichum candidum]KAF5128892.1 hypothetical protein DV495_002796 [Geotrichum candidum]